MNKSDDRRIKKLFRSFRKIKFKISNPEGKIEHDGVAIKCLVHRVDGCSKVDYFVSVDGRDIPISNRDTERARYIFNYVFYCPPDDTPFRERLISFGGYSLVLVSVILGIMAVTKLNNCEDNKEPVIANVSNGSGASGRGVLTGSACVIGQKSK